MNTRRPSLRWLLAPTAAVLLSAALASCAAPPSPAMLSPLLPVTGAAPAVGAAPASGAAPAVAPFGVHEYSLVEESVDRPNHASFEQRVPAAVERHGLGSLFSNSSSVLNGANQALAPFGYRLTNNPTPPFSGFALYHQNELVQRDIIRFSPVSIKDENDFSLSFETTHGEKLLASSAGIRPWADPNSSTGSAAQNVSLAQSRAGGGLASTGGAGELASVPFIRQKPGSGPAFGTQVINGQPFFFYTRGGQVRLSYANHDLPYVYDQVVHDQTGDLAIFNPGGSGSISWFYALRDGVWYYVEVGVFE